MMRESHDIDLDAEQDYEIRQRSRDEDYRKAYGEWVASLPPEERERLGELGLDRPSVPGAGTGAPNRDLAESSGINVERVIAQVWIFGGALAALSGTFFGFDTVKWDIGARILLLVFAAVTLGGLGTSYGALVGALMVGIAINWSTLVIDTELKNMTALVMLILALLLRPQGILGQKQRIG
jgi:hypothetical protein